MESRTNVGKMASSSGGVEWASVIKPILAASYGSFNKNDALELIKAINKRYVEFFFKPFSFTPEIGFTNCSLFMFRHYMIFSVND